MATSIRDILSMYKFFQEEKFNFLQELRGRTKANAKAAKKTRYGFLRYVDEEMFFQKLREQASGVKNYTAEFTDEPDLKTVEAEHQRKLNLSQNDIERYDTLDALYKLPSTEPLSVLNQDNEDKRAEALKGKSKADLERIAKAFIRYQDKFNLLQRFQETMRQRVVSQEVQGAIENCVGKYDGEVIEEGKFKEYRYTFDSPLTPDKINAMSFESMAEKEKLAEDDYLKRAELEKAYKSVPKVILDDDDLATNALVQLKSRFDEKGRLGRSVPPNEYHKIGVEIEALKKEAKKYFEFTSDSNFKVPVGGMQTKDTNTDAEELGNQYNSESYFGIAYATNQTMEPTYYESSMYAGNYLKDERSKFKWKWSSLTKGIAGENILTDVIDLTLSPFTNALNWMTGAQLNRWTYEWRNRAKALHDFAVKYFPTEYANYFSVRQRRIMERNPESILRTLPKIRKFYNDVIRKEYQTPEQFNVVSIRIQEKNTKDLNGDLARKEFQTWKLIGRRFLGNSFLVRNFGFTTAGRLFEGEHTKMLRRSIQHAKAGGNYTLHMDAAIDNMREMFPFFEEYAPEVMQDESIKNIYAAIKNLDNAESESLVSAETKDQAKVKLNLLQMKNKAYDLIQKADLMSKKKRKVAQGMVDAVKKIENPERQIIAIKKLNFLVGNVSKPRMEWWDFHKRIFPRLIDTDKYEENRAEFSRMLNALTLRDENGENIEYKKDGEYTPEYVQHLLQTLKKVFPVVYVSKGRFGKKRKKAKKVEMPKSLESLAEGKAKSLSRKARKDLAKYIQTLKSVNALERVINEKAVEEGKMTTEVSKQDRQIVKINNMLVREIGLLYSMAYPSEINVIGKIDVAAKEHMLKTTNKWVKSISDEAYGGLVKQAESENVDEKNIPFYIALQAMDHIIQETMRFFQGQAMEYSDNMKAMYKKADGEARFVKALMKKLKGLDGFAYDIDMEFVNSYETRCENLQLLIDESSRYRGMESFEDRVNKDFKDFTPSGVETKKTVNRKEVLKQSLEELNQNLGEILSEKIQEMEQPGGFTEARAKAGFESLKNLESEYEGYQGAFAELNGGEMPRELKEIKGGIAYLKKVLEEKDQKRLKDDIENEDFKKQIDVINLNATNHKDKKNNLESDKKDAEEVQKKLERLKKELKERKYEELKKEVTGFEENIKKSLDDIKGKLESITDEKEKGGYEKRLENNRLRISNIGMATSYSVSDKEVNYLEKKLNIVRKHVLQLEKDLNKKGEDVATEIQDILSLIREAEKEIREKKVLLAAGKVKVDEETKDVKSLLVDQHGRPY